MKKFWYSLAALLLINSAIPLKSTYALLKIGASLPLYYQENSSTSSPLVAEDHGGLGASLILPGGLMFRIDQIKATYGTEPASNTEYKETTNLFSIGYNFNLALLSIAGAYGIGNSEITYGNSELSSSARQIYLEVGKPVVPLFDIFLGYHQTESKDYSLDTGLSIGGIPLGLPTNLISTGGDVFSLGVRFGI